ncbi:STOREKEEPER protein-like [Canna indica]|uniref:STOREKEEPER protein-like n=1 Tax=Canna indica TaxID=4628 RepID=A0AAQ3L669_9LILI|nr:STOREKEEPER protein-like [Canna indica]
MRSKRLNSKTKPSTSSSSSTSTSSDSPPPATDGSPSAKPLPMPNATTTATPAPAATSRRSERKRKPREFGERSSSAPRLKKVWSEPDEIALLEGARDFRSRTGVLPKQPTVAAFFASIKSSIGSHLTAEQVGYKLKRLKSKFMHSASAGPAASASDHDRRIFELSSEIWAEEAKQDDGDGEEDANGDVATAADVEEEDGADGDDDKYPFIKEALLQCWKTNGPCLSSVLLEKGLKLIDPSKRSELEEKVKKQCEAEMNLLTKRLDLLKEIFELMYSGL